ncbi:MAG: hypothetical protein JWO36_7457 [Myxococcales bacterium]|nr:hypothetical protein [Myxococcales bacterium]
MVPRRVAIVAAIALVACGKSDPAPPKPAPIGNTNHARVPAASDGSPCEQLPFAESTPVPEASGAAWLTIDGKPALVVISDSGNDGAYAIVDPDTGATLEQGKLPLKEGSDDLEGAAGRDDKLYALSSAGWIRVWKRKDKGFELVDGPYPLGPIDLPKHGGMGDKPPKGDGMVCPIEGTNCGRNYEGLCLRPRGAGGINPLLCTGFAASKADGHLYCLTEASEPHDLVVHRDRAIQIARPGVVADCAFGEDGSLWAGNNLFGMSEVYRVDNSVDPEHAKVIEIAPIGVGFAETLAARGDIIYRMSDTGGSPSLMAKFRCSAKAR